MRSDVFLDSPSDRSSRIASDRASPRERKRRNRGHAVNFFHRAHTFPPQVYLQFIPRLRFAPRARLLSAVDGNSIRRGRPGRGRIRFPIFARNCDRRNIAAIGAERPDSLCRRDDRSAVVTKARSRILRARHPKAGSARLSAISDKIVTFAI